MLVLVIVRAIVLGLVAVLQWAFAHPVADIPLSVLAFALLVFIKPYRTCRWCRPGGLIGGSALARLTEHKPKPRHRSSCWRCKRTRLTRRFGAYHVHKVKESVIQAWMEREFWR